MSRRPNQTPGEIEASVAAILDVLRGARGRIATHEEISAACGLDWRADRNVYHARLGMARVRLCKEDNAWSKAVPGVGVRVPTPVEPVWRRWKP